MFLNLTQYSGLFSKRIAFKMTLFWPYIGIESRKELYIFDRITTSGNYPTALATRTQIVPNSLRTP